MTDFIQLPQPGEDQATTDEQTTSPPPVPEGEYMGDDFNLDEFVKSNQESQKEDYSSSGPAPEQEPDPATAEPEEPESAKTRDRKKRERAFKYIKLADKFIGTQLAKIAGTPGESKRWRASSDDLQDMADALYDCMEEMKIDIELPAWVTLLIAVAFAYWPLWEAAKKMGKDKKKSEQPGEYAPYTEDVPGATPGEPEYFDSEGRPVPAEEFSAPAPQPIPHGSEPGTVDFWAGKGSPVDELKNVKRERDGGQVCELCEENHCNKGKTTCSSVCAGRRSALINNKLPVSRQSWIKYKHQ